MPSCPALHTSSRIAYWAHIPALDADRMAGNNRRRIYSLHYGIPTLLNYNA